LVSDVFNLSSESAHVELRLDVETNFNLIQTIILRAHGGARVAAPDHHLGNGSVVLETTIKLRSQQSHDNQLIISPARFQVLSNTPQQRGLCPFERQYSPTRGQ
jgi:hypothetical protein